MSAAVPPGAEMPKIRRTPGGTIDFDHYERRALRLRRRAVRVWLAALRRHVSVLRKRGRMKNETRHTPCTQ